MLILATNRPQDLDEAILDRVDVSINIGLPQVEERRGLLKLYMRMHVLSLLNGSTFRGMKRDKPVTMSEDCFSEEVIEEIANAIEGFSGRQISKLMISIRYSVTMSDEYNLTRSMIYRVVQHKLDEHREKTQFMNEKDEEESYNCRSGICLSPRRQEQNVGKLTELELKLARRMKLNGEQTPNIVQLNM